MALKRDFLRTLLTAIIQILVVFATQALLARGLGPVGRGSFAACITFMNVMVILFSFGVDSSSSYYLASGKRNVSEIAGACFVISIAGAAFAAIIGYFLVRTSSLTYFQKATPIEFYYAIAAVWPLILYAFGIAILRGTMRYIYMNLLTIANFIIIALATYVFIFLMKLDVKGALLAYSFGAVIPVVATVFILRQEIHVKSIFRGLKAIPQILHYGCRAYISYFSQMMNIQLGLLVMGFLLAETKVLGFYSIAIAVVSRTWIIPDSLYQVLMPRLANEKKISADNLCTIIRVATLGVIGASLILAAIIKPVIYYGLGREFLPAVSIVYILLFGAIFRSMSKIITAYFFGTDRPGTNSAIKFVGVGISLVLLFIMVPLYGMAGGAWATALGYFIEAWIMILVFSRMTKIRIWNVLIPRINDAKLILDIAVNRFIRKKPI